MASTKLQFYRHDAETQKRCDITMDLRRPDNKKIATWTISQKIFAKAFIQDMEAKFKAFKQELENATN